MVNVDLGRILLGVYEKMEISVDFRATRKEDCFAAERVSATRYE
jgi:hypothetical protein